MKNSILLILCLLVSNLALSQGSWESLDHKYQESRPITTYPYNGGLITINQFIDNWHSFNGETNIQFIDSIGTIHRLASIKYTFFGNPLHDISFVENPDASLTLIISELFDWDIYASHYRINIFSDTVITTPLYSPNFSEPSSYFPVGILDDFGYVFSSEYLGIQLFDLHMDLIEIYPDYPMDPDGTFYEICQFNTKPLLYNENEVIEINSDYSTQTLLEVQNLKGLYYWDDAFFFCYPNRIDKTDTQFITEESWDLPGERQVIDINGNDGQYYITLVLPDLELEGEQLGSLWKTNANSLLELIEPDISRSDAVKLISSDKIYDYTSTVVSTEYIKQPLVNRTLKNGIYESDYDFAPPIEFSVSDLTLDSIVYSHVDPYIPDSIHLYNHYYNGEMILTNSTQDTLHTLSIFSEGLKLPYRYPSILV